MKNTTAYILGIGSIFGAAKLLKPKDETILTAKMKENGFGITKDKDHILVPTREAFNLYDMIEEAITMIDDGTDEEIFGDAAISFERLYDILEENGFINADESVEDETEESTTSLDDANWDIMLKNVPDSTLDSMDILTDPTNESSNKKVLMSYEDAKNLVTLIHILYLHDSFEESQLEEKCWEAYNKLDNLLNGKD
mgnify:CR=1 FL=1|nr:MAG TPA: hypothetical protein [Caudoviricetes sp.]